MQGIPEPLPERLSTNLKCEQYFDRYYKCRGSKSQMGSLYEKGGMRSCELELEEFKWCFKAKFFLNEEARQVCVNILIIIIFRGCRCGNVTYTLV